MPTGQLTTGADLNPDVYVFDNASSFNRGMKAGTAFGAPSVTVGGTAQTGVGASVSAVTGNDFAGRFTITAGTTSTGGTVATFAYGTPLAALPTSAVVNVADSNGSTGIAAAVNSLSATGFAIVSTSLTVAHVYTVTYLTIQ